MGPVSWCLILSLVDSFLFGEQRPPERGWSNQNSLNIERMEVEGLMEVISQKVFGFLAEPRIDINISGLKDLTPKEGNKIGFKKRCPHFPENDELLDWPL